MTATIANDGQYANGMAKFLLSQVCEKRKVSQYRLALLLRIDNKNIARLFKPGYDPKLSMLVRCAKALKCKIKDLYKE